VESLEIVKEKKIKSTVEVDILEVLNEVGTKLTIKKLTELTPIQTLNAFKGRHFVLQSNLVDKLEVEAEGKFTYKVTELVSD